MTNTNESLTSAQSKALDKIYENGRWIGSGSIHHATAGALQRMGLMRVQERFADGHCRFILTAKGHKVAAERALAAKRAERRDAAREDVSGEPDAAQRTRNTVHTLDNTQTVVRALTAFGIEGVRVETCGNDACDRCTISAAIPKGVTPDDHADALLAVAQAAIRATTTRRTGKQAFHDGIRAYRDAVSK